MYNNNLRIGAVIPALDEEQSIGLVVGGLLSQRNGDGSPIVDTIVVCDNGSRDRTAKIAAGAGAIVVSEPQKGYGRACLTALAELGRHSPDAVLFIDGDNAFQSDALTELLAPLARGADLVIGSRTKGQCEAGALSASQIFGNRLATFLMRLLWGARVSDLGPYRAVRASSLERLRMRDEAFGWTVEMQVKAIQLGMDIVEVPVNTRVRLGRSKITGTLSGVLGAGVGILSMIAKLRWRQASWAQETVRE